MSWGKAVVWLTWEQNYVLLLWHTILAIKNDRQSVIIQNSVFNRHCLGKEQSEPAILRKKTDSFWCFQRKFELEVKIRIFRTLYLWIWELPKYLMTFLMRLMVVILGPENPPQVQGFSRTNRTQQSCYTHSNHLLYKRMWVKICKGRKCIQPTQDAGF